MSPEPWPILRFLNEGKDVAKTTNRLPHWQQENAAYFVTYRLGDSVPVELLKEWQVEKEGWLIKRPKPWDQETERDYRRLLHRIDRHLDEGHGSCVLAEPANAATLGEAFLHHDGAHYLIHTWVVMPNHVHVLLSTKEGASLERIVSSWKRFTARVINQRQGRSGSLWQPDYFDRMIRDWDHFIHVARYIRRNPAKAGLAPERYLLHTAPWVERLLS